MKRQLSVLLAAASVVLSGCGRTAVLEKMMPADVQEASKKAIGDLEARHFGSLKGRMADELKGRDLDEALETMAAASPNERPISVSPAAFKATATMGPGGTRFDVSYECEFSRTWVMAHIDWVRVNGALRIASFDVHVSDASLGEVNAFTLRGKGAIHYVVLLLGALAATLSLVALVKCIRAKNLRSRWLWIIFILFGLGALSLNWTTGQWHIEILKVQLLSFSGFAAFGGPWMFAVSVPVGAIVFLEKLRKERKARENAGTEGAPPPA